MVKSNAACGGWYSENKGNQIHPLQEAQTFKEETVTTKPTETKIFITIKNLLQDVDLL